MKLSIALFTFGMLTAQASYLEDMGVDLGDTVKNEIAEATITDCVSGSESTKDFSKCVKAGLKALTAEGVITKKDSKVLSKACKTSGLGANVVEVIEDTADIKMTDTEANAFFKCMKADEWGKFNSCANKAVNSMKKNGDVDKDEFKDLKKAIKKYKKVFKDSIVVTVDTNTTDYNMTDYNMTNWNMTEYNETVYEPCVKITKPPKSASKASGESKGSRELGSKSGGSKSCEETKSPSKTSGSGSKDGSGSGSKDGSGSGSADIISIENVTDFNATYYLNATNMTYDSSASSESSEED